AGERRSAEIRAGGCCAAGSRGMWGSSEGHRLSRRSKAESGIRAGLAAGRGQGARGMKVFGLFGLFTPEALWLLLLLPAWWLWRRLRRKDAIVFSRTPVLARGPHVGGWVPRAIFTLRNL